MRSNRFIGFLILLGLVVGGILVLNSRLVGRKIDTYRGVEVFGNGLLYFRSFGRHYSSDGYYYGQKWQCVEFIKRFYFQAHEHRMPEVMGHAKDFFDPSISHGSMNLKRGMIQFQNGGSEPPKVDDLIVFRDTRFGHVAIISQVTSDSVEVVQQNILGKPRQKFNLKRVADRYLIYSPYSPAGWLRPSSEAALNLAK